MVARFLHLAREPFVYGLLVEHRKRAVYLFFIILFSVCFGPCAWMGCDLHANDGLIGR